MQIVICHTKSETYDHWQSIGSHCRLLSNKEGLTHLASIVVYQCHKFIPTPLKGDM